MFQFEMRSFLILLTTSLLCLPAHGAKIISVKNNKALIDLEGTQLTTGSRVPVMNSQGQQTAVVEIKKLSDKKALALVVEGQTSVGDVLNSSKENGSKKSKQQGKWSVAASYSINQMSAQAGANSVQMTGSSYGVVGSYQMPLIPNFDLRATAGYQPFSVSGSSQLACNGSSTCSVDLSYLASEIFLVNSFFSNARFEFEGAAGVGFYYPIQKASNILETSRIAGSLVFLANVGADYKLNSKSSVPVQVQYVMYSDKSTTSTSQIVLRAGYAWKF